MLFRYVVLRELKKVEMVVFGEEEGKEKSWFCCFGNKFYIIFWFLDCVYI